MYKKFHWTLQAISSWFHWCCCCGGQRQSTYLLQRQAEVSLIFFFIQISGHCFGFSCGQKGTSEYLIPLRKLQLVAPSLASNNMRNIYLVYKYSSYIFLIMDTLLVLSHTTTYYGCILYALTFIYILEPSTLTYNGILSNILKYQ